jgi:hypothetical protein
LQYGIYLGIFIPNLIDEGGRDRSGNFGGNHFRTALSFLVNI